MFSLEFSLIKIENINSSLYSYYTLLKSNDQNNIDSHIVLKQYMSLIVDDYYSKRYIFKKSSTFQIKNVGFKIRMHLKILFDDYKVKAKPFIK